MHLVRRAGLVAAATLAALLMAQAAAAQSTADVTLTVPSSTVVPLGNTTTVPVTVELVLNTIVCPQAATATVTVAVADPTPVTGISAPSAPVTLTFNIEGPKAYSTLGPYRHSLPANLTVTADRTAPANHMHSFNVTATFNSAELTGCQSTHSAQGFTDSDSRPLQITTGAGNGVNGNQTGTGTRTTTTTDSQESVALPFAIQVGLVGVAGLVASRRKQK